ncbi:uncharacterized protein LOC135386970 [Ornithodoros turicata]|uniref:uncharacterized protein LOC135386970 n=1 Tax=Ornithodoros turicata TaxID=34597 RepID=UPI0031389196
MPDATAATVARTFVSTWVARFGVPPQITIDRGKQFESRLFTSLTQLLGTNRCRTTAYYPCANGIVERFHRHLKAAIMAYGNSSKWHDCLPLVLLGLRASWKEDLGCTAAALVYGTSLALPAQCFKIISSTAINPSDYVEDLRDHFSRITPTRLGHNIIENADNYRKQKRSEEVDDQETNPGKEQRFTMEIIEAEDP